MNSEMCPAKNVDGREDVAHDGSKTVQDLVSPRVSVVIVTYRSTNELPKCIESVLRQTVPLETFVVDNASPDRTPQMVADYAKRFQNVHAILNAENIGLAAGNNCVLGKCRGEYVLILNPDTALPENSLNGMVNFLDKNVDVGVLGPKNLYEDGTPHLSFLRRWDLWSAILWRIVPYRFPRLIYDRFASYRYQDVLAVSGSCLLIRRRIFEQIGGYDPELFLTLEDVFDLCIRAKATGSRVVFLPDVEVFHYTGRSGAQVPYLTAWQGMRGTIYHFLKHRGIVAALVISLLLTASAAVRVVAGYSLGIFNPKFREMGRVYARILRDLLVQNPMLERRESNRLLSHPTDTFSKDATGIVNRAPASAKRAPGAN